MNNIIATVIVIGIGITMYVGFAGIIIYICNISREYTESEIRKQNVDLVNTILDRHINEMTTIGQDNIDKDRLHSELSSFYDEVIINEHRKTEFDPVYLSIQIIEYEPKWYNKKEPITTDVIIRNLSDDMSLI